MKQITREEFDGTFFDVSEWTDEQKSKFQERCFELGYKWEGGCKTVKHLYATAYYLDFTKLIYSTSLVVISYGAVQKQYSDMFPEELPEPDEKNESIFDNPVWVTCCTAHLDTLTYDKDYKVISSSDHYYKIENDEGHMNSVHKNHFYKVLPEDLLPAGEVTESEEDGCGFEKLVYTEVEKGKPESQYFCLDLNKCSEEQKDYVIETLQPSSVGTDGIQICNNGVGWFSNNLGVRAGDTLVTFNDLFKYKEDL